MIQPNENQSGGIVAGDGQAATNCWACGAVHVAGEPCQKSPLRQVADAFADATEQQLRASLEAEGVDVDELIRDNLHKCAGCGLELDGDDQADRCGDCAGDVDQADDDQDELETYAAMFDAYLVEQRLWIGAPHKPLVHHIRKLCRRLDSDPEASASMSSSYLQAITRLERMRPGSAAPKPGAGDQLGGQTSIFDELED